VKLLDGEVTVDLVVARVAARLRTLLPAWAPDASVLVVGNTVEFRCERDAFRVRVQEIPWADPIVAGYGVSKNPPWLAALSSDRARHTSFRLSLADLLMAEVRDGVVLDGVSAHRSYDVAGVHHRRVFVATTPHGGRFLLRTEAIKDGGAGVRREPRPSPKRGSAEAEPPSERA
jgi:hypothetical protein